MDHVSYGSAFSGGSLTVPPSKSAAIRALLCGAGNADKRQEV